MTAKCKKQEDHKLGIDIIYKGRKVKWKKCPFKLEKELGHSKGESRRCQICFARYQGAFLAKQKYKDTI